MRTDTLFGKNVNVVGNMQADLVLESLGKIYIKSRNKAQTLNEIIGTLSSSSAEDLANNVIIIEDLDELDDMILKDGALIYDKSTQILYIWVDGELTELISVTTSDTQYVKKKGDTMTGPLFINTKETPLKVVSSKLIKNLNAEYLGGLPSSAYAVKNKDEHIGGNWTFENITNFNDNVYFKDNTLHYKDSLHNGSLGTPNFASGFGGYGWRLDAESNTLTIDYIVVRKALYVYELVVNRITATNGSLWVTNASKVTSAYPISIISDTNNSLWDALTNHTDGEYGEIRSTVLGLKNQGAVIVLKNINNLIVTITGQELSGSQYEGQQKSFTKLKDSRVFVCEDENSISDFMQRDTAYNFAQDSEDTEVFRNYRLFDRDFDTEVKFPIVHYKNGADHYKYDTTGVDRSEIYTTIKYVKSYYKYFGLNALNLQAGLNIYKSNFYIVRFEEELLPVFKTGDILRCQKFTGNGIKYYDAVVCNKLEDNVYIIQLAPSIMDQTTIITYDDNLEPTTRVEEAQVNQDFYNTTAHNNNDIQGIVQEGDSLVQIGNLWDVTRQNAVYITSSDDASPFIDVMSGVNRPDYSVIYNVPTYDTVKLYKGDALPYTGEYYIQNNRSTCQYIVAYKEGFQTYSVKVGKRATKIVLWYKDAEGNILHKDFDEVDFNEVAENIRLEEVDLDEDAEANLIQDILNDLLNNPNASAEELIIHTHAGLTSYDLEGYQYYFLRAYPDENSRLKRSIIEECIDLEDDSGVLEMEAGNAVFYLEESEENKVVTPTKTTKARFGRLDGIIDDNFAPGRQPHGFGLYGENVFLTGEFVLSNGKNVADFGKDMLALRSSLHGLALENDKIYQSIQFLFNITPSYGDLEQAGIFISGNQVILLGDRISIITKMNELPDENGYVGEMPTALFEDGKIKAKFLSIQELHSMFRFYKADIGDGFDSSNNTLPSAKVTIDGEEYIGQNRLHRYKNTSPVDVSYIRKFVSNTKFCWLRCNFSGQPYYPNSYYWEPTLLSAIDSTDQTNYDEETAISYNTFLNKIKEEEFSLWSLEYDGSGNLGGNSFYWDTNGNVTVSGTLYSGSGQIGGFVLNSNYMEAKTDISRRFRIYKDTDTQYYVIDNGWEDASLYDSHFQQDLRYRNCSITNGNFEAGNYTLSMQDAPIRLEPEMARITFYSFLNARGTPYDCTLDATNKTGIIQPNGRGALSGDYLTFDDGSPVPTTFYNVSKNGGTWAKERTTMGAQTVLLSITFIPIELTNTNSEFNYSFYVRSSDVPALGSGVIRSFKLIKIYWDSEGQGVICLRNINGNCDWFKNMISSGRLAFNISGIGKGVYSTSSTSQDVFDEYNVGENMNSKFPKFHVEKYDNDLPKPYRHQSLSASITNIFIPESGDSSRFIYKEDFPYTCNIDNGDPNINADVNRIYSLSINKSNIDDPNSKYEEITSAFIAFNTADDSTIRPGGITFQIVYNNYDSLYLPYFSGIEPLYNAPSF